MKSPAFILTALALVVLGIYLFVQAPPPLPEEGVTTGKMVSVDHVLTLVAAENDIVRALWTKEIVGAGKKAGLAFDEHWQDENLEAGPLPALFLRLAAASLERNPVPLSVFLGSDFPISPSNAFQGRQIEVFELIKQDLQPQFFFEEDTELYTAMFADVASVEGCVSCHNEHSDSPKVDWVLNDVMGATTWAYPKQEMTNDEFLEVITAVRHSFRDAYTAYLDKVATFENPPEIGENWPRDGYYLPTAEVFLAEFESRASANTVDLLLAQAEE